MHRYNVSHSKFITETWVSTHLEKPQFAAVQEIQYLQFITYSVKMKISLTEAKQDGIEKLNC